MDADAVCAAGRRFSELMPAQHRLMAGQRPPSPFAHEAEGTAELAARNGGGGAATAKEQPRQPIREQSTSLGSDGTLSRSLSSPELLQLPLLMNSHSASSELPAMSLLAGATPSPLPTNELSLLSPVPPSKSSAIANSASTQLNYLSSSSSLQSLKGAAQAKNAGGRPKMQLNGASILSIDIGRLAKRSCGGASPLPPAAPLLGRQRHSSGGSAQSDTKRNLISLTASVGNAIQRTKRELQRTRLWHAFYAFALPLYTLAGALLFQALDGAYDDHLLDVYEKRCLDDRAEKMAALGQFCAAQAGTECFGRMQQFLAQVESCYRRWHEVNKTITHPMSDFTNAVIYAFSVYTTIGYGTISANSTPARIATVFYGIFGIPLFFAFIKEEGNAFRTVFIRLYNWLKRYCRQRIAKLPQPIRKISASACRSVLSKSRPRSSGGGDETSPLAIRHQSQQDVTVEAGGEAVQAQVEETAAAIGEHRPASAPTAKSTRFCVQPPYVRQCSDFSLPANNNNNISSTKASTKTWKDSSLGSSASGGSRIRNRGTSECGSPLEQRRVFLCGVLVFCVYLLAVSALFSLMTGWDFFTAFYFLFNSVALIGFGDVFPKQPKVILVNMFFIVLGVVLFSMCYFILQEEIRVKAFEASRKARTSIAKYSQSLMLHTRPWSRRNSPAFDKTFEHFDRLRKRRQSAPAIAPTHQQQAAAERVAAANNNNNGRISKCSSKCSPPTLKI